MFNSKKRTYSRATKTTTTNSYNETIEAWTSAENIKMFISLSNQENLQSADMRIQQCSHIGITTDSLLVGDLIGGLYEVTFLNKAGRETIVYMKEIEGDGSFQ